MLFVGAFFGKPTAFDQTYIPSLRRSGKNNLSNPGHWPGLCAEVRHSNPLLGCKKHAENVDFWSMEV
jgi:hypothetical protein